MASGSTGLPAFLRDISGLQIVYIDPSKEVLDIETEGREVKVKVATWSPDGQLLAFVDPNEGVGVATVEEARLEMNILPGSSKSTVGIYWSPLGSTLVTVSLYQKGSSESNLQLWRRTPGEVDFECSSSFVHPKLEAKHQVVKWTADEGLCARLLPEGHLEVHQGSEISGSPALYKFARPPGDFEFAGRSRLAIFVPDLRDDLQRVAAPAEVCVWEVASSDGELTKTEKIKAEVESGQLAELKWNSSGSALLVHCTTEVDDSGKSYYGVSKLLLACADGKFQKDLTEADTTAPQQMGVAVQAVEWSPTRDEFILIKGYQPAKVTLWAWDGENHSVTLVKVLTEKAHRNFIRFNHFGSLVCIAGFGNLAGEVDFYGKKDNENCDFVKISKCEANCAVSAEWGPDGRHLLTAVLFPRMRVDNGLTLWNALTGTKVLSASSEQLYEVAWRPGQASDVDISAEEVGRATMAVDSGGAKKQAYKPPKARGTGDSTVAAMMRGEVAVPDEDRRRRPWQSKKESDRNFSATSPPHSPESEDANGGKLSPPYSPPRKVKDKSQDVSQPSQPFSRGTSSNAESQNPAQPPSQRVSPKMAARVSPELGPRSLHSPLLEAMMEPPERTEQSLAAALAAQSLSGSGTGADLANFLAAAEVEQRLKQQQQQQLGQLQDQLQQQKMQQQKLAAYRQQEMLQALGQGGSARAATAATAATAASAASAASATANAVNRTQLEAALASIYSQQQQQQNSSTAANFSKHMQHQKQRQQLLQQQLAASAASDPKAAGLLQQQLAASLLAQRDPHGQLAAAALAATQGYGAQASAASAASAASRLAAMSAEQERQRQLAALEEQRRLERSAATGADKQRRCPTHGWQYIDPKNNIQGPFSLQEMLQWHRMGFFQQDLRMRCDPADKFIPLKELFPAGSVPFESYPRRVAGNGYA